MPETRMSSDEGRGEFTSGMKDGRGEHPHSTLLAPCSNYFSLNFPPSWQIEDNDSTWDDYAKASGVKEISYH